MPFLTDMYHEQNAVQESADEDAMTPGPAVFDQQEFLDRLGSRIIGQPDALKAVTRAVAIGRAGVTDPGRPLASVLLVGPTGVGKTELVRQVAAELRAGPDDLCRIDMAALAQEHYAASFSGAPPGYAGSKESFTLFDKNKIEGDPFMPGIVLLDEIEKADPTVIRALLHILDSGWLRLANGRETISFRNSYVFITSNLGSRDAAQQLRHDGRRWYRKVRRTHSGRSRQAVINAVEDFFDPEFFNRIDETVVMNAFQPATARQVTALEVEIVIRRLARESVELRVDDAVLELLQDGGFDPVYGARGLRRTIRRQLIAPVAECVLHTRPVGRAPIVLRASVSVGSVSVAAVPVI
ncbi:AAA family ATPase [Mycobacterium sp. Root265]|uniref:AAA family ATPase n=1 Tax=Mycobacterium sp. Root265 TaxID=1736504 RepID=UPI000710195A|nr:AAA family ATPase [Mycobacterium sp. Root265]KRD05859.1 AAA family ATPase [Mycobacterium sp. Root265]